MSHIFLPMYHHMLFNWSCLKAVKCSENDKHCVTTVASFRIGKLKNLLDQGPSSAKCSPSCPNLNMDMGIAAFQTSCCQSFLCNLFGHITAKNETRVGMAPRGSSNANPNQSFLTVKATLKIYYPKNETSIWL
uniref:UPAR/Ly6 domain-containing protein n=1 Tax=Podarcis muralis TaxID=64176 RepID=A0A670I9E1_PODMU